MKFDHQVWVVNLLAAETPEEFCRFANERPECDPETAEIGEYWDWEQINAWAKSWRRCEDELSGEQKLIAFARFKDLLADREYVLRKLDDL